MRLAQGLSGILPYMTCTRNYLQQMHCDKYGYALWLGHGCFQPRSRFSEGYPERLEVEVDIDLDIEDVVYIVRFH